MADILKTEVPNVDSIILAKSGKSGNVDMASPSVRGKKVRITDGDSSVKPSAKKTKSKQKKKKLKSPTVDSCDSVDKKLKSPTVDSCDSVDNLSDDAHTAATGLNDVMYKILKKEVKSSTVIMAKCKTDKQRLLKKVEMQKLNSQDDSVDISNIKSSSSEWQRMIKKKQWEEMGRVKPSVLDKDRERNLQRVATKGVVQLFNAVHKQQALVDQKIKDTGTTESRREKVMQSLTKGQFLDMLKTAKNKDKTAEVKLEPLDDTESSAMATEQAPPTWSVLRDDFMSGATMKDWDKQSDSE